MSPTPQGPPPSMQSLGYMSQGPPSGVPQGPDGSPDFSSINFDVTGLAADRSPIIIGVTTTLLALTIIALSLRVAAKLVSRSKFWWDDYLAIAAWIFWCIKACSTLYVVSPEVGGGKHFWMVDYSQLETFLKFEQLTFMMYPLSMGCAKLSILCLYLKIFGLAKYFRWGCYGLMSLVVGWIISVFLVTLFMCLPFGTIWEVFNPERTCINQADFFNYTAIIDAVLNFLIVIAPLYSIWHLKLSIKKKLAISGVLMLGAGEIIFTILRVVVWSTLLIRDVPWDFYPIILWTTIQEAVGIICINLPAMGPLLKYKSRKTSQKYQYSNDSRDTKNKRSGARSLGNTTMCETVCDEKNDDSIPLKGTIKRTDSSMVVSESFLRDADDVSI